MRETREEEWGGAEKREVRRESRVEEREVGDRAVGGSGASGAGKWRDSSDIPELRRQWE